MNKTMLYNVILGILIIIICISFIYLFSGKKIVYITSANKDDFLKAISNDDLKNKNSILRIEIGSGFDSDQLYIYRLFQPVEYRCLDEARNLSGIEDYARSHGITKSKISLGLFCISLFLFIIVFFTRKIYVKKFYQNNPKSK